jgi:hypothetical protein
MPFFTFCTYQDMVRMFSSEEEKHILFSIWSAVNTTWVHLNIIIQRLEKDTLLSVNSVVTFVHYSTDLLQNPRQPETLPCKLKLKQTR